MNDRFKNIAKSVGNGLSLVGTALADGPKHSRIDEIDRQVLDLLQERDHLIAGLIEPGSLKVSDNYDPNWRKPTSDLRFTTTSSTDGRLTHCEGRRSTSRYHDAHPACPYVNDIHNAHDFTARD